jgi:hypothetical protein
MAVQKVALLFNLGFVGTRAVQGNDCRRWKWGGHAGNAATAIMTEIDTLLSQLWRVGLKCDAADSSARQ